MVWIIQTRLRLNVCNKEVNNVTMNNLFVMQCQLHIVALCSSYILPSQPDKVWQFCKSYDNKKKDRYPQSIFLTLTCITKHYSQEKWKVKDNTWFSVYNMNIIRQQVNPISCSTCSWNSWPITLITPLPLFPNITGFLYY